uniref:Putative secreted protein n=1 Tax=Ixodes ricinus TaxID=34613 RepID=A0A090X9K7_IXORI
MSRIVIDYTRAMRTLIFLWIISEYHATGALTQPDLKLEYYFDQVFLKTVCELAKRNPDGRRIFLREFLESDDGVFIDIGSDPFAVFFGLDYRFKRDGLCSTQVTTKTKIRLQCPVLLDGIRIVLPQANGETTQYVVHAKIKGKVVLAEGTPYVKYVRFTMHEQTYEMFDNDFNRVSPPAQYSLKPGQLYNLRAMLTKRVNTLLAVNDHFSDVFDAALRAVKKPAALSG